MQIAQYLTLFIALEFGATEFFNPTHHPNPVQVLIEMTDGGLDYTFECVGNVKTMVSCRARARGKIIVCLL